jgi:hypothetical protein
MHFETESHGIQVQGVGTYLIPSLSTYRPAVREVKR